MANHAVRSPAPVGGIITMSGAIVLREHTALLGLLVGLACAQMVAFGARYHHLGRLLVQQRAMAWKAPLALVPVAVGAFVGGAVGAAAVVLIMSVLYALLPNFRAFRQVAKRPGQTSTTTTAPPTAMAAPSARLRLSGSPNQNRANTMVNTAAS